MIRAIRKRLTIRAGLRAVGEAERELGALTDEELADAEEWVKRVQQQSSNEDQTSR